MEQLDTFLARQPPFDGLDPAELNSLLSSAREQEFDTGNCVLVEDGPPSPGFWVVLSGSMELVHEGEVVQVLEPGELFGHPSLLTGMAPAFTVRAREPSTCLLFSAEEGRRALGTAAGSAYVADSMRKRMTGTGHTVHALLDVGTTPVSAILRPPAFCGGDESIRSAARRLGDGRGSALLVELGDEQRGIVTDAEIRSVVAGSARHAGSLVSLDDPVRLIARTPAPTAPVTQLAVEAAIDMVTADSEHLVALDGDRVAGVVAAADLLGLDARSPIALRHRLLAAENEEELVRAAAQLPKLFLLLMRAGVPSQDIGRVLTLQHDAVVARLADFSIWRHGEAPVSWAWLDLGSAARREFTLGSDQDNALAYADPAVGEDIALERYFAQLGREINDGLARCGIGIDNNGVLAGSRLWRMSKTDWLRTFDEVLSTPDESHLIRATVVFDFRATSGGLTISPQLVARIRAAREHPDFMRLMARSAAGFQVALGFRGHLATGRDDAPKGKLDVKRGAIIPVVNLIRFHALASGVTTSSTLDRLEAIHGVGALDRSQADALREAFGLITRVRFEHHASLIAGGHPPDNLIDPDELPPIARNDLRDALQIVRRAQKQLGVWIPGGK